MKLTLDMLEPHRKRKAAYQSTFNHGMGPGVLADIAKFCCAFETTASASDRDTFMNEGKRLVWLRIQKHLNFTPEELAVHYDATLRVPN